MLGPKMKMLLPLLWLSSLCWSTIVVAPSFPVAAQQSSPLVTILNRTFYFHAYSLLYDSGNQSIIVYSGADLQPPAAGAQLTLRTMSDSGQRDQLGRKAWAGAVSWVTEPLAADVRILGSVSMYVWMSSSEDPGLLAGSAYGMGIGEIGQGIIKNGVLDTIWFGPYETKQSVSKILSNSPKEYQITLPAIDHVFRKGNRITFAVGIASTRQGWSGQVYFDSAQWSSRVTLNIATQQESWVGDLVVNATDDVSIEGGTFTMIDGVISVYGRLTLKSVRLRFDGLGSGRDFGLNTLQSGTVDSEYSIIEEGLSAKGTSSTHLLSSSVERASVAESATVRAVNSQVGDINISPGFMGGIYVAAQSTTAFDGRTYGAIDVDARQESSCTILYRSTGWLTFHMEWATSLTGQQGYYVLDGSVKAPLLPYVQVETEAESEATTYTAQLVRYYQDSDVSRAGLSESSLKIYKWDDGSWTAYGTPHLDTSNNYVTLETSDLSGTFAAFARDVKPPSISLESPQKSGSQLTVAATVSDNVGVSAVYLLYSAVKEGPYSNATMSESQGRYTQTITVGNKVYYRVVAVDVAGNTAEKISEYPSGFKLPFCWIASASYASATESKLDTLREFRDRVLKTNPLGEMFVELYYTSAPPIAAHLEQNPYLRTAVRVTLVEPVYYIVSVLMSTYGGVVVVPLVSTHLLGRRYGKRWTATMLKVLAVNAAYLAGMVAMVFALGSLAPIYNTAALLASVLLASMLPMLAPLNAIAFSRMRKPRE